MFSFINARTNLFTTSATALYLLSPTVAMCLVWLYHWQYLWSMIWDRVSLTPNRVYSFSFTFYYQSMVVLLSCTYFVYIEFFCSIFKFLLFRPRNTVSSNITSFTLQCHQYCQHHYDQYCSIVDESFWQILKATQYGKYGLFTSHFQHLHPSSRKK